MYACPPSRVLIIGGGEFGLATAFALANGPYCVATELITVLDRAESPPAVDAASSDLNKIVRQDYSDKMYARLAHQAIAAWRSSSEWKQFYHESGTVILSNKSNEHGRQYVGQALELNQEPDMAVNGKTAESLPTPQDIKRKYPDSVQTGSFEDEVAYFNPNCGWANARAAVESLATLVRRVGVNFVAGQAQRLLWTDTDDKGDKDVRGVELTDGRTLEADLVIIAAGSWSSMLVPELGKELLATGQVVATIKLTPDEAERYRRIPVALCLDTGFYMFPPNEENIVKFAIHGPGWLNPADGLPSVPRTTLTPGCQDDNIPREAAERLRQGLERVAPELARKPFASTRLCWYCDSPTSDWLIDFHPRHPSLFFATAGSGHAFKFLPIMGDLVLKSLQGDLPADQREAWSFDRLKAVGVVGDSSRSMDALLDRPLLKTEDMLKPSEF